MPDNGFSTNFGNYCADPGKKDVILNFLVQLPDTANGKGFEEPWQSQGWSY